MSESTVVLIASLVGVVVVSLIGIFTGKSKSRNLEGWLVNSRMMGPFLLWFLMGTEIYTSFTFQGLAGFTYVNGGSVFYNVALNDVAYAIGFLVLPCIWLLGKKFGYVTQSDFIAGRYQSESLGVFVAFSTAIIMIAYVDLNIEGLAAVVKVVGNGAFSSLSSNLIAFIVLSIAVIFGGIHGNAWQSVIKDILMFVGIAALFFVIPIHYFGSFGQMYHDFAHKIPKHVVIGGVKPGLGATWLVSTVLLNAVGQWMWPQWFGVAFTANSSRNLKLQAVFMPLYQLVKVAVITVGFAAVLILGVSKSINGNNVVMMLAMKAFPEWFLILFVMAATFSAIVPAGPIVMTSCSLLAKNVFHALRPQTSARTIYVLTKSLVLPITLLALFLTLVAPALIVNVLLVAYDFISQLFPAVVVGGLFWKRATKEGVFSGLLVGWIIAGIFTVSKHDPYHGINAGLIALAANLIVFWTVSLLTTPVKNEYLDDFWSTIHSKAAPRPSGVVPTDYATTD